MLTCGAIQNTRITQFTFSFGLKAKVLVSCGLDTTTLVLPQPSDLSHEAKTLASALP